MSLYDKSLAELREIAEGLRQTIRRNPHHSRIEQVELEDTEQLIREREKHAEQQPDDVTF